MALTPIQDPSFAGLTVADKRADNHLSSQSFHQPVWDDVLFYQASEFYFKRLVEKYAKQDGLRANTWNWAEKGKWYKKQTLVSATDVSAGVIKFELDSTDQYFVTKDHIDLGLKYPGSDVMNLTARVESITVAGGGNQEITVRFDDPNGTASAGGTQVLAVAFAADHQISLLYNAQGECFTKSDPRFNNPDKYDNNLTKIDNTYKVCDDARNRLLWFKGASGKHYWMSEDERDLIRMHNMAVDMALLFGQRGTFTEGNYQGVKGDGVIPQLNRGSLIRGFAGSVTEDDHQEMITDLGVFSGMGGEWMVIAGPDYYKDTQKALKDYAINGSFRFNPGITSTDGSTVGIHIGKYQFGSKSISLMEYQGFGDPDFLPQNAGGVNYRNFAMYLKLDKSSFCYKYKQRDTGESVKNWVTARFGQTMQPSSGMQAVLDQACEELEYTTHVGVEVKGLQRHGIAVGG